MAVDVGALIPLPALKTKCGSGMGMAVCPALGLLVTSNHDDNTCTCSHVDDAAHESIMMPNHRRRRACAKFELSYAHV